MHFDNSDALLSRILGRSRSMFADDVEIHHAALTEAIRGKRILVVGAAGSIGGAFVKQLLRYGPARVDMVDLNENTLVEVVRDLRSAPVSVPSELRSLSIDFGSSEFAQFAAANGPWHTFLNFSAMKHVRSERDVYSLMRMIDTNVRALADFLASPAARGLERVFSVSTDKSVRPANLMGATKNLMEKVLFERGPDWVASSARFANVAFSAGSLLEGFEHRLAKGQPLAAPADIRRYFISHEEAGQLCLLAGFLGNPGEVFFPKMARDTHLVGFADIATEFLRYRGYQPYPCASEEEARSAAAVPEGHWPCWFSHSDTTGEKPYEEFCRPNDRIDEARFRAAAVSVEAPPPEGQVAGFLAEIARLRAEARWDKARVVEAISRVVPELEHVERHKSLDEKM